MAKQQKVVKVPKDKAHGTCAPTMSAWKAKSVEKNRRASRSGTAGKAALRVIKPPVGGWNSENTKAK